MTNLTIQNIGESVKAGLILRATKHGQSMEEETREILRQVLLPLPNGNEGLGSRIHRRFAALGGVELILPERRLSRSSPDLSESDDT
ncbi:MAG: hypothetical protein ABL903_00680 [Methylococcales bacterium]